MSKDIFKDLIIRVSLTGISKLPYHRREIWQEIKKLPLLSSQEE